MFLAAIAQNAHAVICVINRWRRSPLIGVNRAKEVHPDDVIPPSNTLVPFTAFHNNVETHQLVVDLLASEATGILLLRDNEKNFI